MALNKRVLASREEASRAEHGVQKTLKSKQHTELRKGVEKQLDYILTDKKHYCWSRDAEANDMRHMRSDHRCVMARFAIPAKAKKKTRLSETTPRETDERKRGKEQLDKYKRHWMNTDLKQDTGTSSMKSRVQRR